jgi:hypothetical protein
MKVLEANYSVICREKPVLPTYNLPQTVAYSVNKFPNDLLPSIWVLSRFYNGKSMYAYIPFVRRVDLLLKIWYGQGLP